jgi:hypothetical protein
MVVLTIVSKKNGETIFFEDTLPKVHLAKIISCSFHNSFYTLKERSKLRFIDNDKRSTRDYYLNSGFYNLDMFIDLMNKRAEDFSMDFEFKKNVPAGEFLAKNPSRKIQIFFENDSARLFTNGQVAIFGENKSDLQPAFFSKHLEVPHNFFIHCDLVDREKNLLNGKKSSLLAKFEIKGASHEKVSYYSHPQEVYRECSTGDNVNSITLSVKDKHGEMFDFNGLEMDFVLELV